jgi:glycosidase
VSGGFGPEHVNASTQRHDPDSLLHFMRTLIMRTLIKRYRSCPEMGWGVFEPVKQSARGVLVHRLSGAEGRMVALHNFRGEPATVDFTLGGLAPGDQLVDLLVDGRILTPDEDAALTVQMDGYGYRWFRVISPDGKQLG